MNAQDDKKDLDIPSKVLARTLRADNEMARLFLEEPIGRQYKCCQGLAIWLTKHDGHNYLDISLGHLSKERITELFYNGELIDEMLLLYELGHLPFADAYIMKLSDSPSTHIVDRVRLHFDKAFNVFDRDEWTKHDEQVIEKATSLSSIYEYEPFYARLREAKHKNETGSESDPQGPTPRSSVRPGPQRRRGSR